VETPNLRLTVRTSQPGLQFYTGNFLPEEDLLIGKEGASYVLHGAFAVEPQRWPDSVNNPEFPQIWLESGVKVIENIYLFD
jgi:aldose 1-epimerase